MTTFKDFESLQKKIMERAEYGMQDAVLPSVQTKMLEFIKNNVYDVYNPLEYVRRRASDGGLETKDNIVGYRNDYSEDDRFYYTIKNLTHANGQSIELAPLVEMGQVWAYSNYPLKYSRIPNWDVMVMNNKPDFTPFYEARPFIAPTREWAKENKKQLATKLKKHMTR